MVLALAILVFAAATVALALLVEPIPTWYYHLAWGSYIIAADALNRRLGARSLLRDRPGRFFWIAAASVVWWTLFEAINQRLGNWYYVMDPSSRAVRWPAGVLAFATVLPGIVETVALVENLGWLRSVRVAPLRWSRAKEASCLVLGAACFALPLLWPNVFFPLTWGSFVFLIEPWNRRHARRSFLRDLEAGEAGPFCRTLLAGFVCGVLWEAWNFWARTKWVYTVPVFEELKLFEMPLLGFLGFPPFAVESLVVLRFAQGWLQRRLWTRRPLARAAAIGAGAAAVIAVFSRVDPVTVDSLYLPVAKLTAVPAPVRAGAAALGLGSPERLRRALGDAEERARLAAAGAAAPEELERAREAVALVLHQGLGADRARQLERVGVRRVADLAAWRPEELSAALRAQGAQPRDRFLERRAGIWIRAARRRAFSER
jgi:predicted flap endonuclease-1-like 5' DNA nuclease